jgi:enoyl-CoA hydratase
MEYQTVTVTDDPPLAIVALNRPAALNALNGTMASEIVDALTRFEADDSIRCVIFTGNDRVFCAGADIKEMGEKTAVDMMKADHFRGLWEKVGRFPKPTIAAISGYALGGGLELAMCCDIIIAAEGGKVGQPEINIGIMPGGGGTQRLTHALGKYKATEMILTGAQISVEEAHARGLVNRVVPADQYLDEAKRVGREIATKGSVALKLAKLAIGRSLESGLSDGLEFERELFYMLFATKDKDEGMRAFREKRTPRFAGE